MSTFNPTQTVATQAAPWRRLGRDISHCKTAAEAIAEAGLNWRVELRPISATLADGSIADCPENFATVRTDTNNVLGVVGSSYHVMQNAEAFACIDGIIADRKATFETAGLSKGGRQIWLQARLPMQYDIAPGDTVYPYVLCVTSHDGSSAVRIMPSTFRMVCTNQLSLAMRQAGSLGLSIVHTASLKNRLEDASRKFSMVCQRLERFDEEARTLTRRSLTREELANYFAGLVTDRSAKQQREVLRRFAANVDNSRNTIGGIGGTAWAAYNAVSEWADHQSRVIGRTSADKLSNRLQSVWFDAANKIKQAAWESALALTA
jgi:phage/plasmid-like protein (TIGR03299 family)